MGDVVAGESRGPLPVFWNGHRPAGALQQPHVVEDRRRLDQVPVHHVPIPRRRVRNPQGVIGDYLHVLLERFRRSLAGEHGDQLFAPHRLPLPSAATRYFTAPAVRPRTMCRCTSRENNSTGTIVTTPTVEVTFHSIDRSMVRSPDAPTGTVWEAAVVTMNRPIRNSFQVKMMLKIAVVIRPGPASGRMTRPRAAQRVHPSTTAASSISVEMSSKNARMIQTTSGIFSATYGMMSP